MAAMAALGKSWMDLSCRTVEATLETAWVGASGSPKTPGSTPPNVVVARDEIDRWGQTVAGQLMEHRAFALTGADGSHTHLGSTLRAAMAAPVDPQPCDRTARSLLDRVAPPGVSTCRAHPSSTRRSAEDALRVVAGLRPCQLPPQQPPADVPAGVVGSRLRRTSIRRSAVDVLRVQAAQHPPLRLLLDAPLGVSMSQCLRGSTRPAARAAR